MDNMYMDTYYFFVPNRLVWDHWKNFMGEHNEVETWTPDTEYTVPTILPPQTTGWKTGSLADYLGLPVGVANDNLLINHLPFRAYALICSEWFRDQGLQDAPYVYKGEVIQRGTNGTSQVTDIQLGGTPFIAAKYHDYFTSSLKSPQAGPSIGIFGNRLNQETTEFNSFVPVVTRNVTNDNKDVGLTSWFGSTYNVGIGQETSSGSGIYPVTTKNGSYSDSYKFIPNNLYADIGQMELSINQLRLAFQLQKFYEKQSRGGQRYREVLKTHFSITSSDARMQIPEYLGGHRFPLSIHQVANQTASGEGEFLGDLGAMSNTSDINEDFIKSFEEHGWLVGVCVCRYDHSYVQGYERFWRRSRQTDYYFPVFANIGEQPVYQSELYVDSNTNGDEVFGYQEAWADYRYKPNRVSGEMRPGIQNSLATWHLADYYQTAPNLSADWIREDKSNVDRVLSVTSSVSNQIFADFYVQNICTRPMPMYSIPGLIDHH